MPAKSSVAPAVVWFRDDLRVTDQPALTRAVEAGRPLVWVYVDDTRAGAARALDALATLPKRRQASPGVTSRGRRSARAVRLAVSVAERDVLEQCKRDARVEVGRTAPRDEREHADGQRHAHHAHAALLGTGRAMRASSIGRCSSAASTPSAIEPIHSGRYECVAS